MEEQVAGPRRYKVSFECNGSVVGTLISVLVKEVESPKMEPCGDDTYKIALLCMQDQLPTIYATVVGDVSNIVSSPFVPETKTVSTFRIPGPKVQPVYVPQGRVTIIPPKVRRVPGQRIKPSQTAAGLLVMTLFDNKSVIHNPDVIDLFEQHQRAGSGVGKILADLTREGILVRAGWGAYRRPTAAEYADFIRGSSNSTREGE